MKKITVIYFTTLRLTLLFLFCLLINLPAHSQIAERDVPISVIAWSPDGDQFAVTGGVTGCGEEDTDTTAIFIFDATSKSSVNSLLGNNCDVVSVAWSPDGSKIAASGIDARAKIWDVATGVILTQTELGTRGRGQIVWSPDGTQIANILMESAKIEVWDAQTGKTLKLLGLNPDFGDNTVLSISWHPNGDQIVSGGTLSYNNPNGFVRVWDVNTESVIKEFEHPGGVYSVAWKPDGTQIASGSGNNEIRIWDVGNETLVKTLHGDGGKLKWHPFKNLIAGNPGGENSHIAVWDTELGSEIQLFESEAWIPAFDWSPYGGQIIYNTTDNMSVGGTSQTTFDSSFSTAIPEATLQNVQSIAQQCIIDGEISTDTQRILSKRAIASLDQSTLPTFIADIASLPEGNIPESCRTDLIAVGNAVDLSPES